MTRPVLITGLMVLILCPVASGARGVKIEGVFVRSGQLTPIAQINVGDPVRLIVRVSDISDVQPQGVAGGKVDVTWNSDVLQLLDEIEDEPNDTTDSDVSPLFNQAVWTWAFSGVRASAGSLVNMGAAQGVPPKMFAGESEVFFALNFNPIAPGQANVTLNGHDFGVIPADPESAEAAAERYEAVNPVLEVLEAGAGGVGQPIPPPGAACCGPAPPIGILAIGMLMLAGRTGTLSGRRRQRR